MVPCTLCWWSDVVLAHFGFRNYPSVLSNLFLNWTFSWPSLISTGQISYYLERCASSPLETAVHGSCLWCEQCYCYLRMLERNCSLPCWELFEPSASLLLKTDEASFCMRQGIIALKKEEIMTNSKALGRIWGHLADSIFSYSLSGRCSSRAVSGGRALSAGPSTQILFLSPCAVHPTAS